MTSRLAGLRERAGTLTGGALDVARGAAANVPLQQMTQRLQEEYRKGDYTMIGQKVQGMIQERVDLQAVKDAGFGAVGAAGTNVRAARMQARARLLDLSTPMRLQLMVAIRDAVKANAVADPDMCLCVARNIEKSIDLFWDDLTVYVETSVADVKESVLGRVETEVEALASTGEKPCVCSPKWWRALVLYHMLPFDRSFFGQAKDPIYWLLFAVSLVSAFGIRIMFFTVILVFLVLSRPPDEYQLVLYILMFKGAQFISSGCFLAMYAALKYYLCVHPDGTHTCNVDGPGATQDLATGLIDIFGSSILVWVTFLILPCSTSYGGSRQLIEQESEAKYEGTCCCMKTHKGRGGRIAGLLYWDLFSFILSCLFLGSLVYFNQAHLRPGGSEVNVDVGEEELIEGTKGWMFRTSVFWARIFYSMLAFPFLPFNLPVLMGVLTHTRYTGFNRQGACVPFMLHPMPEKKEEEAPSAPETSAAP